MSQHLEELERNGWNERADMAMRSPEQLLKASVPASALE